MKAVDLLSCLSPAIFPSKEDRGVTDMKQENTQSGILAASKTVVTFTGRDGDDVFNGAIALSELELTESLVEALVSLAAKTLLHRQGKCEFKASPSTVNAEEFARVAIESLAGGSGRFKITDSDRERAKTAMKYYSMAPEQTESDFIEKYGKPFTPDEELLAAHYRDVRAAEAAEKKAKKSML